MLEVSLQVFSLYNIIHFHHFRGARKYVRMLRVFFNKLLKPYYVVLLAHLVSHTASTLPLRGHSILYYIIVKIRLMDLHNITLAFVTYTLPTSSVYKLRIKFLISYHYFSRFLGLSFFLTYHMDHLKRPGVTPWEVYTSKSVVPLGGSHLKDV